MKKPTAVPNILKVFARDGRQIYLCDLRSAVYPYYVTVTAGIISGLLATVVPVLVIFGIGFIFSLFSQHFESFFSLSIIFDYLAALRQVLIFSAVAGVFLPVVRKFFVARNLALVKQVDADIEFRINFDEVCAGVLLSVFLFSISETARFFSLFTVVFAYFGYLYWQYFHDIVLAFYARVSKRREPQKLFAVWSAMQKFEFLYLRNVRAVGIRDGGKTVVIKGDISEQCADQLREKLPEKIKEIEQIIIQKPFGFIYNLRHSLLHR